MSTEHVKLSQLKAYKRVAGKLDVRRLVLECNSDSVFGELIEKLARAYKVEPSSVLIYWKDSEGDYVSIDEDDDVRVALNAASGSLLKVYVTDVQSKFVAEEFGESPTATPTLTTTPPPTKQNSGATGTSASEQASGGVHHPNVTCDGCSCAIFGRRFKCVECDDYDLCERCELVLNRHPQHNMVLIRRPSPFGWPFVFGARRRFAGGQCGPSTLRGCPVFGPGPRGQRCGRFRCQPPQSAEKPQTAPNEQDGESVLNKHLADLVREAQNGQLPTVLAAVSEALLPLGADLAVLCSEAASRGCSSSSTATATERNASANASASASAESSEQLSGSVPSPSASRYAAELLKLQEMGFDNTGGWIEQLLVEKRGNVSQVLDALMSRQW